MKKILIASLAVVLASCSTAPAPRAPIAMAPPPPVVIDNPLTVAAEREAMAKWGGTALKPGDFRMLPAKAMPVKGPVTVLVSLRNQRTYFYKAGQMVAFSTHSHGTPDHPTDPGKWTILAEEAVPPLEQIFQRADAVHAAARQMGACLSRRCGPGAPC